MSTDCQAMRADCEDCKWFGGYVYKGTGLCLKGMCQVCTPNKCKQFEPKAIKTNCKECKWFGGHVDPAAYAGRTAMCNRDTDWPRLAEKELQCKDFEPKVGPKTDCKECKWCGGASTEHPGAVVCNKWNIAMCDMKDCDGFEPKVKKTDPKDCWDNKCYNCRHEMPSGCDLKRHIECPEWNYGSFQPSRLNLIARLKDKDNAKTYGWWKKNEPEGAKILEEAGKQNCEYWGNRSAFGDYYFVTGAWYSCEAESDCFVKSFKYVLKPDYQPTMPKKDEWIPSKQVSTAMNDACESALEDIKKMGEMKTGGMAQITSMSDVELNKYLSQFSKEKKMNLFWKALRRICLLWLVYGAYKLVVFLNPVMLVAGKFWGRVLRAEGIMSNTEITAWGWVFTALAIGAVCLALFLLNKFAEALFNEKKK